MFILQWVPQIMQPAPPGTNLPTVWIPAASPMKQRKQIPADAAWWTSRAGVYMETEKLRDHHMVPGTTHGV